MDAQPVITDPSCSSVRTSTETGKQGWWELGGTAPLVSADAKAPGESWGAVPASSDQPCFPVSVEVRTEEHDGSVITGWASINRTAHFEGRTCQVKGWA